MTQHKVYPECNVDTNKYLVKSQIHTEVGNVKRFFDGEYGEEEFNNLFIRNI